MLRRLTTVHFSDEVITEQDFKTEIYTVGIALLVVFVGAHTMSAMRVVLVPVLWAMFLVMGLLPIITFVEDGLVLLCCKLCPHLLCVPKSEKRGIALPDLDCIGFETTLDSNLSADGDMDGDESRHNCCPCCQCSIRGFLRSIAVFFVLLVASVAVFFIFFTLYKSILQLQGNVKHYQLGFTRIARKVKIMFRRYSRGLEESGVIEHVTAKAMSHLESFVSTILNSVVEQVTGIIFECFVVLLYVVFALFQPYDIGGDVSKVFKPYILLKSAVSSVYAFCVWLLLTYLQVDLSAMFGMLTFLFNFLPEVGPFFSIVLPLPMILFDGRQKHPVRTLIICVIGQFLLKFFFGNLVEVMLIERQKEMRMHPVAILFFVAFFGWIWGPTGMLLSVPLMAALKASCTMYTVPKTYRKSIITVLEGNRH